MFFTLGGQRLDLSSLSKAKSNIAFRVALRAETAEDSRDVIGSDAALHLPSKENGYALLKAGPRELDQFRCFYVSAPFVVPKKPAGAETTVALDFSRPRALTWEYQPLSAADSEALCAAEQPEQPEEYLYHPDGFKKKKLLDVIRESLMSHSARPRTGSGCRRSSRARPLTNWCGCGAESRGGRTTATTPGWSFR